MVAEIKQTRLFDWICETETLLRHLAVVRLSVNLISSNIYTLPRLICKQKHQVTCHSRVILSPACDWIPYPPLRQYITSYFRQRKHPRGHWEQSEWSSPITALLAQNKTEERLNKEGRGRCSNGEQEVGSRGGQTCRLWLKWFVSQTLFNLISEERSIRLGNRFSNFIPQRVNSASEQSHITRSGFNLTNSLYLSEEIIRSSEGIPFKAGDSPI